MRSHSLFCKLIASTVAAAAVGCGSSATSATCPPAEEPFGINAAAGESFPDVELTGCSGQVITLDALRCEQKVTLISIGAGWCIPCNEETPELEAAYKELLDEDIGVVQVLVQNTKGTPATTSFCTNWVDVFDLTMPVYIDPPAETLKTQPSFSLPLHVIVDKNGVVIHSFSGGKLGDIVGTLRTHAAGK